MQQGGYRLHNPLDENVFSPAVPLWGESTGHRFDMVLLLVYKNFGTNSRVVVIDLIRHDAYVT